MTESHPQRGFTLIELMIAVAVVAILVSLAYPSFTDHLRRSRRAEAQQALMEVASRQQQILLDTRAYASTLAATGFTPPGSVLKYYSFSVVAGTNTFTVSAAPIGGQVADACGTLTVNEAGVKGQTGTGLVCW